VLRINLVDLILTSLLFAFIFRARGSDALRCSVELLELSDQRAALSPVAQMEASTAHCTELDELTNGIQQSIDVCGIVYIGFDHTGVTPSREAFVRAFFDPPMASRDHLLIDPNQGAQA